VALGGWPVGKKPVIRLLGLNGGGGSVGAGLLHGSVDSEKVGREWDVVGGRHCARVLWVGSGGGCCCCVWFVS
jgi:hypothetical protein